MNQGLTWAGVGMVIGAILIPILVFGIGAEQGGWEAVVFGILFAFIISPLLGIGGIILFIVGLASRGPQNQQQQVVVHVSGNQATTGSFAPSHSCAHCGHGMNAQQAFCTSCGTRVLRG